MSGHAKSRYSIASFSTGSNGALGTIEETFGHLQTPLISNATGNVNFYRQNRFDHDLRSRQQNISSLNSNFDSMAKETVFINSAGKAYVPIPQTYTGVQQLSNGSGSTHLDRQSELETEAKAIHERYFGSIDRNRTRSNSRNSVSRSASSASRPNSYHQQLSSNTQQHSSNTNTLDLMSPLMNSRKPIIYNQSHSKPLNEATRATPPSSVQPMVLPIRPLSEFFTNPGRASAFHPPMTRSSTTGLFTTLQGNPIPNPIGSSSEMEHGAHETQQNYEHDASSVTQREVSNVAGPVQYQTPTSAAPVRQSSRFGAFIGGSYAQTPQTPNHAPFIQSPPNRFQAPPPAISRKPFSDTFRHNYEDGSHSQFTNHAIPSYRSHQTPETSGNTYSSQGVQYSDQGPYSAPIEGDKSASRRQAAYNPNIKCEVAVKSARDGSLPRNIQQQQQQPQWIRTLPASAGQNLNPHTTLAGATVFTFENLGDEQPDLVDVCYYQGSSSDTYVTHDPRMPPPNQLPVNDTLEVPSNSWKRGYQTNANNVVFANTPETPHGDNSGFSGSRLVPRSPAITRKKRSSSRSQLPVSKPHFGPRGNSLHEEQIHSSNDNSHQLKSGPVERSYASLPRQKRKNEFNRDNTLESEYGHTFDTLRGFSYEELLQNEIEQLTNQLETEQQSAEKERQLVQNLQNELRSYSPDDYRELIQQELEEERVLREEAEARVRDLIEENESSRGRLQALHTQLSQLGRKSNQLISSLHKPTLNKTKKLQEKLSNQNASMRSELENLKQSYDIQDTYLAKIESLSARVAQLEAENKKLSETSSTQKESYEKCLDEVSQKVSTALTAQKDLQAEYRRLQDLVKELENENKSIRLQLDHKVSEPSKEQEAPSNSQDRWKLFDQLDASNNESKALLEKSPSSSQVDPTNFFHNDGVIKDMDNETLNLSNVPSEETDPDEVLTARGVSGAMYEPEKRESLAIEEFLHNQDQNNVESSAVTSLRADESSPRQVFNTLEHSNSTNSADSAIGFHMPPLTETNDPRAPPIPTRPLETKSKPVHMSHVSMRLSGPQDPKYVSSDSRPASQNNANVNGQKWSVDTIQQPLVRSSHIGSVVFDKKLASSRQGSQSRVGSMTPRQTSFEDNTDNQGQVSGPDCENIREEVIREELYDFLPVDPSISNKPHHGSSRPSTTKQEPDYLEPKPSEIQSPRSPKSPQTKNTRNFSPPVPQRRPIAAKERPRQLVDPKTQKSRIPGFSPNRVINSSQGMQLTNEAVEIDNKEHMASPETRAKLMPKSKIGHPSSSKNIRRSPSSPEGTQAKEAGKSVDIWERKPNENQQNQQPQHIHSPRQANSRLPRTPVKQMPPDLPPNHPSTPLANRKQVVGPNDVITNDVSGRPNSSSSNEMNQRFERSMEHPDDRRIREIAMKYSSPPMSPTFDRNPEDELMDSNQHRDAVFASNITPIKEKKLAKQNKSKQSSIPVKNIKQMNPKDMKTPVYHPSSDSSESSSKNKKSLKLKIPSLLKKHSGHHFSKSSSANQNSKKPSPSSAPVVIESVKIETAPPAPEIPASPRMIRKPEIKYNYLVDPRTSFSDNSPDKNVMRSPVMMRRNDESRFQVSSMRHPSDVSGGDDTIGDTSTLVNNMSDQEEIQSENEPSQQNSLPENEYDKIATTDDESLNGPGDHEPLQENLSQQGAGGGAGLGSDSAGGDEVDGFNSRAAFLENWIDTQTTSATSSEDDNGPFFGSPGNRDRFDPVIVDRMKKAAVKKRSNVKDVDFNRFGAEENQVLEQFSFLNSNSASKSQSPSRNQPCDQYQESASQVAYNTADFSTFATCSGVSREDAYFSDSLCNDGSVNNFGEAKSESEQTLPDEESSHPYMVLDHESHHTNIYEHTFPSTQHHLSYNS